MIAHRLGTLANCDVRLEIENGRLISSEHTLVSSVGRREATPDVSKRSRIEGRR
jgi:hypothetical protein